MKLRKARYLSPCTKEAGKGREAFHWERECSEGKWRVLELENICWMGEEGFAGWIGARNNGGTIPLRIVHSSSNLHPDKRRFRVHILAR
jgi:hypothetical protein